MSIAHQKRTEKTAKTSVSKRRDETRVNAGEKRIEAAGLYNTVLCHKTCDLAREADSQDHTKLVQIPPAEPIHPLIESWECASAVLSFKRINPDILAYAPIHFYLRPWCDGRYSRQCLRRMLTDVIDQESWHALRGVEEWRALHASNCVLIECLLRALDARESQVAA